MASLHTDETPHECQHCHFKTKRKDKLKAHVKRMHSKKDGEVKKSLDEEMALTKALTPTVYAEYLNPKRPEKQET